MSEPLWKDKKKDTKFIQIIAGEFNISHGWQKLFALDSEGQVWELVHSESAIRWEKLEVERVP